MEEKKKIVVDANIIIAALFGSRATIIILTGQNYSFYAPKFIINEIKKHKNEICQKAKKSLFDFDRELQALLIFIIFLDKTQYNPFFNEAEILMNNRDSGDVVYIASALAVHADFIWTNDKDFTAQFLIPIKNTEQFIEENK